MRLSILRFVPSALGKGDTSAANGFVKFSSRVILILAIVCSLAIFIFFLDKIFEYLFHYVSFMKFIFFRIEIRGYSTLIIKKLLKNFISPNGPKMSVCEHISLDSIAPEI